MANGRLDRSKTELQMGGTGKGQGDNTQTAGGFDGDRMGNVEKGLF